MESLLTILDYRQTRSAEFTWNCRNSAAKLDCMEECHLPPASFSSGQSPSWRDFEAQAAVLGIANRTFDSIKPYTVEETYEVLEAIDNRDWPELSKELGDLLLQVLFYAQMAKEQGDFSIDDVLERRPTNSSGDTRMFLVM